MVSLTNFIYIGLRSFKTKIMCLLHNCERKSEIAIELLIFSRARIKRYLQTTFA